MSDFFKGWRRKAGLVTLAMALLVTGGWLRSHHRTEEIGFPGTDKWDVLIGTAKDCLFVKFTRVLPDSSNTGFAVRTMAYDPDWPEDFMDWWRSECRLYSRNVHVCGFRYAKVTANEQDPNEFEVWAVPYWSLVLPLTPLSAWFILGKRPKASQPPKTV